MRICMICPEIGKAGGNAFIGGSVNNVVRLSKALSARGHQITIVTTPHRYAARDSNDRLDWAEVACLRVSGGYASVRYGIEFAFKAALQVKRLHKLKRFDIIHGHSGYSMPGLITGISGKITKTPSVHTLYCEIQPTGGSAVKLLSNKFFTRFYLSPIDRLIAVTENVQSSLTQAGLSNDRVCVVPLAIEPTYNPSVSGDSVRQQFNIGLSQPVLLYIGNLSETKGIHILIDALTTVAKQIPQVKLLMVLNMPLSRYEAGGAQALDVDMKLLPEIKEKIESRHLDGNIRLVGITDRLPSVIAASDMIVVPFLNTVGVANYPLSLLEAMAMGKPAIASRIGAIPRIVSHMENGILVDPGNAESLAKAIVSLCQNREFRERLGRKAATTIASAFSIERCIDQLETLYKGLCENRKTLPDAK